MANYPYRAPMAIVDIMRPYIEGKTYCELGTHEGDIMLEIAKFAKSAIGIEWDKSRAQKCRDLGLDVIYGDFTQLEIPKAEVYYIWCAYSLTFDFINKCPGLWILGRRPEDPAFQKFGEEPTILVPFEDSGWSGTFDLLIKEIK